MDKKDKILIVISGGCLTQVENALGVLAGLYDSGLLYDGNERIDARGTSAGAVISTCMAAVNWKPNKVIRQVRSFHEEGKKLVTRKWFWWCRMFWGEQAIYDRSGFENLFKEIVNDHTYENVTNIVTGFPDATRVEMTGSFLSAVASTSIRRVFPLVKIDGHMYGDGGYVDNVPLEPRMLKEYKHVFVILPPEDIDHDRKMGTFIGKVYKDLDIKISQEVNEAEYTYSQTRYYPNCTVIRPGPFDNSPMSLSDDLKLIDHAYTYTLAKGLPAEMSHLIKN